MNNCTQPRYVRSALPTIAAGALFVCLSAIATAADAQSTGRLAVVSPSANPAPQQPATPPTTSAIQQQASASLEAVGAGDSLRISVFRNPDLNTEARVTEQGTILFPLIGEVKVTGLSPQQVGNLIADKLRAGKYVVNPEVSVAMAQVNSRQVAVLGNVTRPGRYPIDNVNSKLTDFIAAAGGVAGSGSDSVTVLHTQDGQSKRVDVDLAQMFRDGNLANNMALSPGDTIFVHRAPVVYVYGEVQKAGAYRLEPQMTVMQAIAMGGGLTTRGTERGVRIHRRNGEGVKKIDAHLTDTVQGDDVIFVRESIF
ncbi:MAG TPA: polysaccharide export protein EpsE [Usitatibacter sp.]|nr:polysaccharide export protein EpsE [Usitatibacter sp.]